MPLINNPFKPNQPIYTSMFAGRTKELDLIEQSINQTKSSNPTNILIIGERGIGKTSLLIYSKYYAEGKLEISKDKVDFLTLFISIDKRTTINDLARKINTSLERELRQSEKTISFIKESWKFIKNLEIGGSKLSSTAECASNQLFDDIIYALVDTIKALTDTDTMLNKFGLRNKKDGIVIFIDEADNADIDLDIGTLLKQLSERLVIENCNKILFIIAGLPETRDVLSESHFSSLRLFNEIELTKLSEKETNYVIKTGIEEANKFNDNKVNITESALSTIYLFSQGYPHFIQQFGYTSYEVDEDCVIDDNDVKKATIPAYKLIGSRYYLDMYFKKINNDSYRDVLKIMCEKYDDWISKSTISEKFKGKSSTLTNALQALTERKIILKKPGTKGEYRLQCLGFAFWIKFIAGNIEKQYKLEN